MHATVGLIPAFPALVLGRGGNKASGDDLSMGWVTSRVANVLPGECGLDALQEPAGDGLKTRPASFFLTTRHGLPSAITSSGMSLYTADCIPITTPLPMTVLSLTAQFSPMNERVPICVPPPSTVQLEMTEWLPITMSWPTMVLISSMTFASRTVLLETKEPGPTMHPGPIWAVGEIRALGSIRVVSG